MRNVLGVSGRNLRLFFRDPLNVFFSLMGALIIFVLYALFLGNLQMLSISAAVPEASAQQVRGFVDAWMLAAVVALSAMTTPLGALSVFVEDGATTASATSWSRRSGAGNSCSATSARHS